MSVVNRQEGESRPKAAAGPNTTRAGSIRPVHTRTESDDEEAVGVLVQVLMLLCRRRPLLSLPLLPVHAQQEVHRVEPQGGARLGRASACGWGWVVCRHCGCVGGRL
jgi:hypothetical protein